MKKVIALLMAAMMMVGATACGAKEAPAETEVKEPAEANAEDSGETEDTKETFKLGIDLCADDLFNQQIRDVLVSACEERGWEYLVTVNYQDAANNVSNVQNMITVECDYIMSYSTDIGGQETVREMCDNAGIGVVFIGLEEEGYTTVAGGNYEGGKYVGQKLVEKANEIWDGQIDLVIVNEFVEVGEINTKRMGGMVDGVKEAAPDLTDEQFVYVDGGLDVMKSTEVMAAALAAHPDDTHILCLCAVDDYQGHGSWNAATAAGRQDQVLISGFHVVNPATPGMVVNYPDVWIGQADLLGSEYGKTALSMIDAMIAGEDITGEMWYCDYVWMDASNIGEYYDVVD